MKLKGWLLLIIYALDICGAIGVAVFYVKGILTADIPLWLKLYLLGGK